MARRGAACYDAGSRHDTCERVINTRACSCALLRPWRKPPGCSRLLGSDCDESRTSLDSGMSASPQGDAVAAGECQPHILVVDDTQEILDLLQELLQEGYRVTTSQARLDLAKLKALAPDVIIQELLCESTQEEGWKFLALVRLDPQLARIPLILCTGAVQTVKNPDMAAQLDRLRVRVVLKPFDIEDLLAALRDVLPVQVLRL